MDQPNLDRISILWFVVASKKRKKTAAHHVLRKPLEQLQQKMVNNWEADISDEKLKTPLQLLVNNFSCEELHAIMKRNGNQMMGMFDKMSSFYAQLDLFKHTGNIYRPSYYRCLSPCFYHCNDHSCCFYHRIMGAKTFLVTCESQLYRLLLTTSQ